MGVFNPEHGSEIAAQRDSAGIFYQGYDQDFHLCIHEEPNVQGRNERYEFRCDSSLECCGRVCCVPEVAAIPLWLWLLFLILGLLALLALLSLLAYWCARRKRKQKKDMSHGYRTIRQMDDDLNKGRWEKFVPSPLQERLLEKPRPIQAVQMLNDDPGAANQVPEPVSVTTPPPLKARHAIYRPFVPDSMEETDVPRENMSRASQHDLDQVLGPAKKQALSTVDVPPTQHAEFMFTRPGFDNAPAY